MIEEQVKKYIEQEGECIRDIYELARSYHKIGQTAPAITFYLKLVDECVLSETSQSELDLMYECLLHAGECFSNQGRREGTARVMYHHAERVLKDRPEAYFLLSKNWSYNGDWQSALHFIELAEEKSKTCKSTINNFEYISPLAILLQKLECLWNWGEEEAAITNFEKVREELPLEQKVLYEKLFLLD
jgi:tetratricopeptide (TPR) repeat protein